MNNPHTSPQPRHAIFTAWRYKCSEKNNNAVKGIKTNDMKDPRKKAEQLIRAYINVMPPLHPNISTGERILSYAKASSLLHVKEMLKIEDLFNPNRKYDLLSDLYYDFWRKVKKEIINIKVGELKF